MQLGVILVTAAAAAAASQSAARTLLWNDLAVGMSPADVVRLHPARTAMVTPTCKASLAPVYTGGRLTIVVLHVSDGHRCSGQLLALNNARYGESRRRSLSFSGSMTVLNSHSYAWRANSVLVQLSINPISGAGVLTYRPA